MSPNAPAPDGSLATKLSNILNSFSLDNGKVSKSKNALNDGGTIGGYLEKGISSVGKQIVNLRNITQSVRSSGTLFANTILDAVGVDKRNPTFTRDFTVTE